METHKEIISLNESVDEEWEKFFTRFYSPNCKNDDLIVFTSSRIQNLDLTPKEQEFFQYEFKIYKKMAEENGIFLIFFFHSKQISLLRSI